MINENIKNYVIKYMNQSIDVKKKMLEDDGLINKLVEISKKTVDVYNNGGKVLLAGNGGSAGDAQHIAGELVNKFFIDRPGLPCIALSTDTSILTAVGNDYSFDKVFYKQVEANGRSGDVFLGISTSGNSKDIVEALKLCKKMNIITIGFTGEKVGEMDQYCDYLIKIPSIVTPNIQEGHIVCYHLYCAIIEELIFGKKFI